MNVLLALLIPGVVDLKAGNILTGLGIALGVLLCYGLFIPLGIFWHLFAIGHSWRVLGSLVK